MTNITTKSDSRASNVEADKGPTTITGYIRSIAAALEARGVDSRRLLSEAGLALASGGGPLDRVTLTTIIRIYELAAEATGDPVFGLEVAKFMRPTTLHALGLSLEASSGLRDFGQRLGRFLRFASQGPTAAFIERDTYVAFEYRLTEHAPNESEDAALGFFARLLMELSAGQCRPSLLCMRRPHPTTGDTRHREAFGCPVVFGQSDSELRFDRAMLDVPFPGASQELAQLTDQVVIAYLTKLDRADVEARVKTLVIQDLPSGSVSKTEIAKRMQTSARTLQHKLAQRNTTFHDVVKETRLALAEAYIENASMSLKEIAYLLGFSEASNFSRAFKRWTGRSPSEHRFAP